jgi:hypothetical protein
VGQLIPEFVTKPGQFLTNDGTSLGWTGDVMTALNVKGYGAKGDGTTDDTAALQAAIEDAESSSAGAARTVFLPAGVYKITASLVISKEYVAIVGDGQWSSRISYNGVTGAALKVDPALNYLRCRMSNFGIVGNSSSGPGIDLRVNSSVIVGQVYLSEFSNLSILSGGTSFLAPGATSNPQFFSNCVRNVYAESITGHNFHIWSGPGNSFLSLYAGRVPAGKAGYRMTGTATLIGCNGLNDGDVWGAFGSEPAGSDGFQGDFGANDYIELTMIGCNVERFGSLTAGAGIGIRICNNYRTVNIIGGTIQRADDFAAEGKPTLVGAGSYKALISTRYGPNQSGNPIRVGFGAVYLRDVVNSTGTNTPSQAHFYAENGGHFEDTSNIAAATSITTYRVNADGPLNYPMLRTGLRNDIYGGWAYNPHALSPRRLTIQHVRYDTGSAITPVGTNQSIDVTGRSKVVVTPASAATVNKATFTATPGDNTTDYARNGDLIIEAGNGNLTLVHSASGANTFNLSNGADLVMAAGQVVRFTRSDTGGNWWQAGTAGATAAQYTMDSIFHNPYVDLWTTNGKLTGPPDGFTTSTGFANFAVPGVGGYPGNPVGTPTAIRFTQFGTSYSDALMIVPSAQPWNANDQVSFMIAICVEVGQDGARVLFDNGSTQTVIGNVTANGAWQVVRGTGTLIAGNNWKIAVASHNGTSYVSKQLFVGGVTIVRGSTPPSNIADSFGRRGWVAQNVTYAPPFVGCRAYVSGTGKWYMAANTTSPADWIILN